MEDKSKALYTEHLEEYRFYAWPKRRGFHARVKNLAKQIDNFPQDKPQRLAHMRLDIIATRTGISLEYRDSK